MKADGADPFVRDQGFDEVCRSDIGAIAHRDDIADGEAARLHGEIEREVAALADDGNAFSAVDGETAMLVGPQRNTVEQVEHAVAIGTDERDALGGLQQGGLPGLSFRAGFGEIGGVADRAAGPLQFACERNGRRCGRRDEHGIGCSG